MSVLRPVRKGIQLGAVLIGVTLVAQSTSSVAPATPALAAPAAAVSMSSEADDSSPELLLVLDSSGSMKEPDRSGSSKIAAAKRALRAVVAKLPKSADVGMRVYGATVFDKSEPGACTDSQLVVPIGPVDKPALRREIGKYTPYGETPIAYSLKQAAKDLGGEGQRTILLVSDGEETCDPDPCGVARQLHRQGVDLKIDVVGMSVSRPARQQLECVADAGGGSYCESGDAEELTTCLGRSSLRAFRPFSLSGTAVDGALRAADAPEIGPGQYRDTLGGKADPDGTKYYSIPHVPDSSLHVGITAWPPSHGGLIGYQDGIALTLATPDGADCGSNTAMQMSAGVRGLLADGVTYPDEFSEPSCAKADRLLLQVQRADVAPKHGRVPFELVVIDEPPLASRAGLPKPVSTDPTYEPPVRASTVRGRVAGGGAFADAATLRPGTWEDSLQPGEVLFYRVRADWGQTPAMTFRFGPDRDAGEHLGTYGVAVNADAYGPARHNLYTRQVARLNKLLSTDGQEGTVRLVPIRYRNRESSYTNGLSLAGYYYFSVNMEETDGQRFQVPMEISVAVEGEPTGQPEYAEVVDPTESAPTPPSESPTEDDDGTAGVTADESGGSDGGDMLVPVAAAGIAGGVLLLGVAFAMRLRRLRDRPSQYR